MANLIDPIRLMEQPENVKLFIEERNDPVIYYRVGQRYDEEFHGLFVHCQACYYDMDQWEIRWRAWDELPTARERSRRPWRES